VGNSSFPPSCFRSATLAFYENSWGRALGKIYFFLTVYLIPLSFPAVCPGCSSFFFFAGTLLSPLFFFYFPFGILVPGFFPSRFKHWLPHSPQEGLSQFSLFHDKPVLHAADRVDIPVL